MPDSALSIGPRLRALAVYLVVFQHVPVERCRDLIRDVAGADVSAGFIRSCLRKAADLAAEVVRLIAVLITAARVAGFDETTLRSGPAGPLRRGETPDDFIDPKALNPLARSYLREAFRAVASVQANLSAELSLGVRWG